MPRSNGASAVCWRASIATPSRRCARRSSPCPARISCASCSSGRASRASPNPRAWKASMPSSNNSRVTKCRRRPGKATCWPRACTTTTRIGWTASVCPAARSGRVCSRASRAGGAGAHHAHRAGHAAQLVAVEPARRRAARRDAAFTWRARAVTTIYATHGASFFDDMVAGTKLLRSQAETALGELVSAGLVNADSYSGLRALLIPSDKKRQLVARGRRVALFGLEDAGRWSLIRVTPRARMPPERERGAGAGGRDPAAPLWRGVSQGAGARGGLAAALACSCCACSAASRHRARSAAAVSSPA